jgi:peptidyl-tRNA hydrolase
MNKTRMYICIKKSIPSHKVLGAAHGVLMAHLKFQDKPEYQEWLKESFRKVVCEVNDEMFEHLKKYQDYIIVTESGLGNQEIALVFCPRAEWPSEFKYFSLLRI